MATLRCFMCGNIQDCPAPLDEEIVNCSACTTTPITGPLAEPSLVCARCSEIYTVRRGFCPSCPKCSSHEARRHYGGRSMSEVAKNEVFYFGRCVSCKRQGAFYQTGRCFECEIDEPSVKCVQCRKIYTTKRNERSHCTTCGSRDTIPLNGEHKELIQRRKSFPLLRRLKRSKYPPITSNENSVRRSSKASPSSEEVVEILFLFLCILAFVGQVQAAMALVAPVIVVGVIVWVLRTLTDD